MTPIYCVELCVAPTPRYLYMAHSEMALTPYGGVAIQEALELPLNPDRLHALAHQEDEADLSAQLRRGLTLMQVPIIVHRLTLDPRAKNAAAILAELAKLEQPKRIATAAPLGLIGGRGGRA